MSSLLQGGLHWALCVCPVPEHPPAVTNLSLSLSPSQRVPSLSPPARRHRGGLPAVPGGAARGVPALSPPLVLPPVPGALHGPHAWVLWQCVCPAVSVPTCLSLYACPHISSPCLSAPSVPPDLSPPLFPRVCPPVPVPAASRWCQENGSERRRRAGGVGCSGGPGVPGRAPGSPRARTSVPRSPPRNPFCSFPHAAHPKQSLPCRSIPALTESQGQRLSQDPERGRCRPSPGSRHPGVRDPSLGARCPLGRSVPPKPGAGPGSGLGAGAAPRGSQFGARRVPTAPGPLRDLGSTTGNVPAAVTTRGGSTRTGDTEGSAPLAPRSENRSRHPRNPRAWALSPGTEGTPGTPDTGGGPGLGAGCAVPAGDTGPAGAPRPLRPRCGSRRAPAPSSFPSSLLPSAAPPQHPRSIAASFGSCPRSRGTPSPWDPGPVGLSPWAPAPTERCRGDKRPSR